MSSPNQRFTLRRRFLSLEPLEVRLPLTGDTLASAEITGLGPSPGSYSTDGFVGESDDLKDVDLFLFTAVAGSVVTLSTSPPSFAGYNEADTYLRLFNAAGAQLAADDDGAGVGQYSLISGYVIPASGDYYLGVSVYDNTTYNPNVANSGVDTYDPNKTGDYALTISIDSAPTDIKMGAVQAVGFDTLSVSYEIGITPADPFEIGFFRSNDAALDGADLLFSTIPVSDPADLHVGPHTFVSRIGSGVGQLPLPGAGVSEVDGGYHILAVADDQNTQVEDDAAPLAEDNTSVLTGAYLAGSVLYAHGTTQADTISVVQGTTFTLRINGTVLTYAPAAVTALRIRALGGGDIVFASASTRPMWISGGDGSDVLLGGAAADTLSGDAGNDSLAGGGGNDTYRFDGDRPLGSDSVSDSGGNDTLDFASTGNRDIIVDLSLTTAQIVAGANLTLTLAAADLFENVVGGARNDTLTGNARDNVLTGGVGSDTLSGAGGNDTLYGGAGNDILKGGNGNDSYQFDADSPLGVDSAAETGTTGRDSLHFGATTTRAIALNLGLATAQVVNSNLTLTLSAANAFENIVGGSLGDTLTGNGLANALAGNGGNDALSGLGGRDILIGGDGADNLNGGADQDILIAAKYSQGTNVAALIALMAEWVRTDVSDQTRVDHLKGTAPNGANAGFLLKVADPGRTVTADTVADTLTGGAGRDWFFRKLGQDTITDLGVVAPDPGPENVTEIP